MRFTRWERLLEGLERPLVFYDTEATSPNPKRARVVEFAAVAYGPASLLEPGAEPDDCTRGALACSLVPGLLFATSWRVGHPDLRTDRSLLRSEHVHGIKASDLVDERGLPLPDVLTPGSHLADARSILGDGYVCGYNSAEYDDPVLHEGRVPPPLATRVDVLRVYRAVTGRAPSPEHNYASFVGDHSRSPAALAERTTELHRDTLSAVSRVVLGARHEGAHGALADAMRTAEVLAALMELWPETCPGTLDGLELLTLDPGPPWCGWDRMLKFELGEWVFQKGEHRGLALGEVDRGYLNWMVGRGRGRKPDFEAGTVREVTRHLDGLGPSPRYAGAQ